MVKNLPADAGHLGWIPEWEDPLEEEMATHYSILAWEIPWKEEPRGLQSIGSRKSQSRLSNQTTTSYFTAVTFKKKKNRRGKSLTATIFQHEETARCEPPLAAD